MLKRLKYVSQFAQTLSRSDVDEIAERAVQENARNGITGVLVAARGIFFQIIEGPPEAIDALFARIQADPRHLNVLLLASQDNADQRLYPDWAMKSVNLESDVDPHFDTLRTCVSMAFEQRRLLDELVGAIERAVWKELVTRTL